MKKILSSLVAITMLIISAFSFVACNNISLYNNGLEIIALLDDMIHDDAFVNKWASVSETELELIYADDYDTPFHVFEISNPSFDSYVETLDDPDSFKEEFNNLPQSNQEYYSSMINMSYIVSTINGSSDLYHRGGIRIVSVFRRTKTFSMHIDESTSYLYVFKTGRPILVHFEKLSFSCVRATGYFLLLDNELTLDNVKNYFSPYGCEISEVKFN